VLERGWTRLMREFGVRFDHEEARRYFSDASQDIQGDVVHFDPDGELIA